ncbi:MAG: signal peptidase I [Steroidobacteraceae bacterium]
MFAEILDWLTVAAVVFGVICAVDDLFIRPRRRAERGPDSTDPQPLRTMYFLLPFLVIAAVLRLLRAERLDFSLVLVLITVISGALWAIDVLLLRRLRAGLAARAAGGGIPEPMTIDYARSFFPVALLVLLVRSFLFEPYRIPSDSMMPTLLDGDFIVVNKFAYGLRLPVLNRKFLAVGEPQRGDVVVFRYPPDPAINYIKRLVGLPGDRVTIRADRIYVNDQPVPFKVVGSYDDGCYRNMQLAEETLGEHQHQVMFCNTPGDIGVAVMPSCNRSPEAVRGRNYFCQPVDMEMQRDLNDAFDIRVPEGKYLMIGDNRDNSSDGRVFGFVSEELLVGKATRIWFNLDLQRSGGPNWGRIGKAIE